ncbi:hypothetical protein PG994_000359 [Apiospora phragmitis]|uniref:Tr-type G domain-containing protein n=1 Tax=Apiospora phragmitis TaxID=2905665 RepID=A0ABR1X669_9PEZI
MAGLCIIAHVDAGKTTTTEAMLYNSGATRHLGNVDRGNTVTDFLPMEMKRGITIQSAAITFKWPPPERLRPGAHEHIINLIDTPGHVDFRFEVERCIPILDGAVCVIDGVEGVEAHTERVWASAQEFKVPRIILVNKLDREGASFKKSVQDIGMKLNGMPLVCQIPWWENDTVKGIVDVASRSVVSWPHAAKDDNSPEELAKQTPPFTDEIERARDRLIEQLCDQDERLLDLWTDQGATSPSRRLKVPSAVSSVVAKDLLFRPQDRPELNVRIGSEIQPLSKVIEATRHAKVSKKEQTQVEAVASVFKVVNDPKREKYAFVDSNLQDFERPLNIMQISAKNHMEIPHLTPGQIGALTGLKRARTGDTLMAFTGNKKPTTKIGQVKVRPPDIPPAVAFLVMEPKTPSGLKHIEASLENLSREDPSVRWSYNEKSDEFTLSGMGSLHLEIARDRLENHYKVEALWGGIQVEYKECVTIPTDIHRAVIDKPIAGKPGMAACSALVEPLDANPAEIRPQLVNGAIAALAAGPRKGAPFNQCLLTITFDASTDYFGPTPAGHYVGAAQRAVRTAVVESYKKREENIGILEPVMSVTITCPESAAKAVQHDLHSARGGQVLEVRDMQDNTAVREGGRIEVSDIYAPPDPYEFQTSLRETRQGSLRMLEIVAQVPLKEMLDYDNVLRSKTAGRHSLTMALDTFVRVTGAREKAL